MLGFHRSVQYLHQGLPCSEIRACCGYGVYTVCTMNVVLALLPCNRHIYMCMWCTCAIQCIIYCHICDTHGWSGGTQLAIMYSSTKIYFFSGFIILPRAVSPKSVHEGFQNLGESHPVPALALPTYAKGRATEVPSLENQACLFFNDNNYCSTPMLSKEQQPCLLSVCLSVCLLGCFLFCSYIAIHPHPHWD